MRQLKAQIRSHIVDGSPKRNRTELVQAFRAFEGLDVTITIEKAKKKRSDQQNRYYHGVIIPLIQDAINTQTGDYWEREMIHNFLREKFLKSDWHIGNGVLETRTKSTTELSTTEFCEYADSCVEWAREQLGIEIPEPSVQTTFQYS